MKLPTHKTKYHHVKCNGGPWDGLLVTMPKVSGLSLSLPIRVKEHKGRYNLDTGEWVPHG